MSLTAEKRQELINEYVNCIFEGMDIDDLFHFVADTVDHQLENYTDEQLENEIREYYPHLLDNQGE